jgi:hypothetical protein
VDSREPCRELETRTVGFSQSRSQKGLKKDEPSLPEDYKLCFEKELILRDCIMQKAQPSSRYLSMRDQENGCIDVAT